MPWSLKNESALCSPNPTRELLFGRIPGFTHLPPGTSNMETKASMEHLCNDQSTQRKSCPSVTLFATILTWPDPWIHPGTHGERPVNNHQIWNSCNSISTLISCLTGSTTTLHYKRQLLCCLVPSRANKFFTSTKCPYQLWGTPALIQRVPVSLYPG